jgi:uncharacterized ferredoxin-like protein
LSGILTGNEIQARVDTWQEKAGGVRQVSLSRDAKNNAARDACAIIGAQGRLVAGVRLRACGFATFEELAREGKKNEGSERRIFPDRTVWYE